MRYVFLLIITFFVSSCSNPTNKYLGYWELEQDTSSLFYHPIIAKIEKKDNLYYLTENVFFKGRSPIVLEEKGNKLSANSMFGSVTLQLTNNGTTLAMVDKKYKKISSTDFETLKKNLNDCNNLRKTYDDEARQYQMPFSEDNRKKLNEIIAKYKKLSEKIQNCKIIFEY